ncbi:MAG: butyrate kinase [Synergistaceae bacterium]|nr:butyrate kinase [Synergistaceae bacterium]
MKILALSPYYNYTKVALFENYGLLWSEIQSYGPAELELFPNIISQEEFRAEKIKDLMNSKGEPINAVGAFVSVGGMLHPLEGGVYPINAEMIEDLLSCKYGDSPMNLGAPMANRLANMAGCRYAYIVDPPVVDEMSGIAHMTGFPDISRRSVFHALNHKAVAAREAMNIGKPLADCNFIVCNLDTTISIAVHSGGKVVEVNDINSGSGPMSPRQTGDLPPLQLLELCFSGKYSLEELRIRVIGAGGFVAHLGTDDFEDIVKRVRSGDRKAVAVFEAFMHQLVKHIAGCAGVLDGRVDSTILTGLMAANEYFRQLLAGRIDWIAPIVIYPGSDDIYALIEAVLRVMRGVEAVKSYS